jgi:hypothetical protein
MNSVAIGLFQEAIHISEDFMQRIRLFEDSPIGKNSRHRSQDRRRHPKSVIAFGGRVQPVSGLNVKR